MNIEKFIIESHQDKMHFYRPEIICNDGFKMSVQGSEFHYCSPRSLQKYYFSMEIGFPSQKEDLIMSYAEQPENPTETVYGWVPCEVIDEVILKHGGINEAETFKQKNN